MRDKSVLIIVVVAILAVVALATGFERTPNTENRWLKEWDIHINTAPESERLPQRTVEAEGAEEVEVKVKQAIGEMTIAGGATALMEGTFDTNRSYWRPSVDYSVEGTTGELDIVQSDETGRLGGNSRNEWTISMDSSMPIDLYVESGLGEALIDLRELNVSELSAKLGVGETTIDVSGTRTRDMEVNVESGLGETEIVIPSNVAVRLKLERGLGEMNLPNGLISQDGYWVNTAYADGGPTIEIDVKQGVGEITVTVAE